MPGIGVHFGLTGPSEFDDGALAKVRVDIEQNMVGIDSSRDGVAVCWSHVVEQADFGVQLLFETCLFFG